MGDADFSLDNALFSVRNFFMEEKKLIIMEDTNHQIINITITGPESSGKSTLAKALANNLPGVYVEEYSRRYLEGLDRNYGPEDIPLISQGQLNLEKEKSKEASKFLICDTGQLVLKIWMEYKYGFVAPEVEKAFIHNWVDLYLLCRPDIPWEDDPLRENPHDREVLFDLYHTALEQYHKPYLIIEGKQLDDRLSLAQKRIRSFGENSFFKP